MYYRIRGTLPGQPGDRAGDAPKRAMHALVDGGTVTGLIGYETGVAGDAPVARGHLHELPVGWVSLGPREQYEKLRRSPVMRAVDDEPVWSVVCFVVPSEHRGRGVTVALLRGAIDYAREQGAGILEAYPVDRSVVGHASAAWFGSEHMFAEAGFEEVARRRADRPLMRLWLR